MFYGLTLIIHTIILQKKGEFIKYKCDSHFWKAVLNRKSKKEEPLPF